MEVYNFITQKEISTVDDEIARLQEMIATMEQKTAQLTNLKPTNERTQVKINYTRDERRFDYSQIKALEESEKVQPRIQKAAIDKNWLAANMEEPDILTFYEPSEFEVAKEPEEENYEDDLTNPTNEGQFELYLDSMANYAHRFFDE